MSARQKRGLFGGVMTAAVVAAAMVAATIVSRGARATEEVHRVTIVADTMAFHLGDENGEANPTLSVPVGKPVEIRLRNEAVGAKHNLAVPPAGVRTPILDPGESAVLRFTLTDERPVAYVCDLHPMTMRGELRPGGSGSDTGP